TTLKDLITYQEHDELDNYMFYI
ncbi:transcriptional regulator, partial [Bacillus cereus]|nr:transcriptional regulator [Bacillus cereus]